MASRRKGNVYYRYCCTYSLDYLVQEGGGIAFFYNCLWLDAFSSCYPTLVDGLDKTPMCVPLLHISGGGIGKEPRGVQQ